MLRCAASKSHSSHRPFRTDIHARWLESRWTTPSSTTSFSSSTAQRSGVSTSSRIHPARCFTTTSSDRLAVPLDDYRSRPSAPPPLNEVNVPLISPGLHRQLFPRPGSKWAAPSPDPEAIRISAAHLKEHGLASPPPPDSKPAPAIDFDLPPLQGPTISHHFHALGQEAAEPYLGIAKRFVETDLPPPPEKVRWEMIPGWTHYHSDGSYECVDHPDPNDDALVFDVETLKHHAGHFAVIATAVGKSGWYGWVSPWVTGHDPSPNHLIPLGPERKGEIKSLREDESEKPRIVIGHHVLFDRARVGTEYSLKRPATRWIDTLSLHVAVSGLTSVQRPTWLKYQKAKREQSVTKAAEDEEQSTEEFEDVEELPAELKSKKRGATAKGTKQKVTWHEVSSVNSLVAVARLHCGIEVDKSIRNVFIDPETTRDDIVADFGNLMSYCASDVDVTTKVYRVLLPKFLTACPHPVSFAGVALMSQPVLPVDYHWPQYLQRADAEYQKRLARVNEALVKLAEDMRSLAGQKDEDGRFVWEKDPWLRLLDWDPKRARRSSTVARQVVSSSEEEPTPADQAKSSSKSTPTRSRPAKSDLAPKWYTEISKQDVEARIAFQSPLAALLMKATWRKFPIVFSHTLGYLFAVPVRRKKFEAAAGENRVAERDLGEKDDVCKALEDVNLYTIPSTNGTRRRTLFTKNWSSRSDSSLLACGYPDLLERVQEKGEHDPGVLENLAALAEKARKITPGKRNIWLRQLDWTRAIRNTSETTAAQEPPVEDTFDAAPSNEPLDRDDLVWPKWYWDLDQPGGRGLEITVRKKAVPLLLKLLWRGYPIAPSRSHGWVYGVPNSKLENHLETDAHLKPLKFEHHDDMILAHDEKATYFKLPHPDGEDQNVGNPLSKPFLQAFEDGVLTSAYPIAADALELNASCSYWAGARERITNQMVVWDGKAKEHEPNVPIECQSPPTAQGLILPQMRTMGTVTRRAVEETWLTASNAKKNRVGSELKSMIRAPPGYSIVGADVDSEELWICSVMGDAQFGVHGGSAIGWMTLEGTKSAGTDLHSKTASILGISRDAAKVFNYSRIYGAGVKHATQLLLKHNPVLVPDQAVKLAQQLYASTKGVADRSKVFGRAFWYGGTESFVFNKLEEIAHSDRPRTPALGCGLTTALTREYLPSEQQRSRPRQASGAATNQAQARPSTYLPSRINWVVQSSGVDYLHLLMVSMEYLTKRYDINARFMLSVHDEIRYVVKDDDKYRAALALQVANVWTRALFCYRLEMDHLPQSCAFFSAVDIDTCFRKEVNMTCVTPSNPDAIPFGESLDISSCLAACPNGLGERRALDILSSPPDLRHLTEDDIRGEGHRSHQLAFLKAQTAKTSTKIRQLGQQNRMKQLNDSAHTSPKRSSPKRAYAGGQAASYEDFMDVPDDIEDDFYTSTRLATRQSAL